MDIKNVQLTELKPTVGHWITKKVVENENERFFSDFVILAQNDSVNNYEEWTEAQKVAWEEEHQPKLPPEPESPYTDFEEIPPA